MVKTAQNHVYHHYQISIINYFLNIFISFNEFKKKKRYKTFDQLFPPPHLAVYILPGTWVAFSVTVYQLYSITCCTTVNYFSKKINIYWLQIRPKDF